MGAGSAVFGLLLSFALSLAAEGPAAEPEDWLLIDTTESTLSVMRGETAVETFAGISIGRAGATWMKSVGDQRTPLGSYRLYEIRDSDRYYRFLALDYPSLSDATNAWRAGRIDAEELAAIRSAHERGFPPPASTSLGGHIGIHGIGEGDARIHEDYNWTDGCIALDNAQIDALLERVRPGMTVVIR